MNNTKERKEKTFRICHMAFVIELENEIVIFDDKHDKTIFESKSVCHMTFSCLQCKATVRNLEIACDETKKFDKVLQEFLTARSLYAHEKKSWKDTD